MGKIRIYFDCDGFLLNTIGKAIELAKEGGFIHDTYDGLHEFFLQVNWEDLIKKAGVLDNAIEKIRLLLQNDDYDIEILTKISGGEAEIAAKTAFFDVELPGVDITTVDFDKAKNEVVDPVDAVLIDDEPRNVLKWRAAGGIGILFSKERCDLENDIVDDIAKIEYTKGFRELKEKMNSKNLSKKLF